MLPTFFLFAVTLSSAGAVEHVPTADEVVVKMIARENQRQSALYGYTSNRRYVLENRRHHKSAEMLVRLTCARDGSKQLKIISENGWGGARKHVFPRLLEAEAEASQPAARERSRFLPNNYSFEMVGLHSVDGRPAYELKVAPKSKDKYLMKGRIWVDAEDYAIARIEGEPARNPSFWIKSVSFVHTYGKRGEFWFPVTDRTVTEVRVFGTTELRVDYFDHTPGVITISSNVMAAETALR